MSYVATTFIEGFLISMGSFILMIIIFLIFFKFASFYSENFALKSIPEKFDTFKKKIRGENK